MTVVKYMFVRLAAVFAGLACALAGVMFAIQWMRMGHALTLRDLDILVLSLVPMSSFVIPTAVLFSILLVLEHMSLGSEIVAMRACGVRNTTLFIPVILLALVCAGAHAAVTTTIGPVVAGMVKERLVRAAPKKILAFFEERSFNDRFKNVVIYVDAVNQKKRQLRGIFIEASKPHPMVIAAEKGTVDVRGAEIVLRLMHGSVFTSSDKVDRYIAFGEYAFTLEVDVADLLRIKSYDTATQAEFRRLIAENPTPKRIREYHNRYAFPIFNLLLAFVGICFGIQNPRSPRYTGFIVGMVTMICYYFLNVMGARLSGSGAISPVMGAWLPNTAFASFLAAFLAWRAGMREVATRRRVRLRQR